MVTDPTQLLRQLEPAVRPGAAPSAARGRSPLEAQSFDELLAQARRGAVRSDRPVEYAYAAQQKLDAEQLERLSAAADLAEASGARRALMLVDGRGLLLDVGARALEGELSADAGLLEVDAAVFVGDESASPGAARGPSGVAPRVVAQQIDSARTREGDT